MDRKSRNYLSIGCAVIHPDSCTTPINPGGTPSISFFFMGFLGNIMRGDKNIPAADMHITTMIKEPLFVDDTLWTFYFPFIATIFWALSWKIVMLVSYILCTFVVSNFIFSNPAFRIDKSS